MMPRAAEAARVTPKACLRHVMLRACLRHVMPKACLRHDAPPHHSAGRASISHRIASTAAKASAVLHERLEKASGDTERSCCNILKLPVAQAARDFAREPYQRP